MDRWAKSAQDADYLLIADTGSNDKTCEADSWGSKPYDLAAIAAFRLGLPELLISHLKMSEFNIN